MLAAGEAAIFPASSEPAACRKHRREEGYAVTGSKRPSSRAGVSVRVTANGPVNDGYLAEAWLGEIAPAVGHSFDAEGMTLPATDADGTPIGALSGHSLYGRLHIGRLATHPDHRGRGVGAALMGAAESRARDRGLLGMAVSTWERQAERFYAKRGFTEVGRPAPCAGFPAKIFMECRF